VSQAASFSVEFVLLIISIISKLLLRLLDIRSGFILFLVFLFFLSFRVFLLISKDYEVFVLILSLVFGTANVTLRLFIFNILIEVRIFKIHFLGFFKFL